MIWAFNRIKLFGLKLEAFIDEDLVGAIGVAVYHASCLDGCICEYDKRQWSDIQFVTNSMPF